MVDDRELQAMRDVFESSEFKIVAFEATEGKENSTRIEIGFIDAGTTGWIATSYPDEFIREVPGNANIAAFLLEAFRRSVASIRRGEVR